MNNVMYWGDHFQLWHGSALALPLPTESVDLVVTSPPYFALRSYRDGGEHYAGQIGSETSPDEFIDALIQATREMVRVLKPTGSIWVNLGDKYGGSGGYNNGAIGAGGRGPARYTQSLGSARRKSLLGIPWRYAIRCVDELGLTLRAEVIWDKPNGLPESVEDRVRRSHEQWFHFTKHASYYANIDAVREPYKSDSDGLSWQERKDRGAVSDWRGTNVHTTISDGNFKKNGYGRLPGSVWTIPTEPLIVPDELGVDHFAAFPTEWPKRIIAGWCPELGVVLDPFCGTGTTVAVARALGRYGIGVDLSEDYLRLANWRVAEDGYRKVVAKVTGKQPAKQPANTIPLFGD